MWGRTIWNCYNTLNSTMPAFLKAHLALAWSRLLLILLPLFLQAHRQVHRCCSNFSEMILVCLQVDSFGEVRDRLSRVGMSEGRAHVDREPEMVNWFWVGVTLSLIIGALERSSCGSVFIDSFAFLSSWFSINFIKFSSWWKLVTLCLLSKDESCWGWGLNNCFSFDCSLHEQFFGEQLIQLAAGWLLQVEPEEDKKEDIVSSSQCWLFSWLLILSDVVTWLCCWDEAVITVSSVWQLSDCSALCFIDSDLWWLWGSLSVVANDCVDERLYWWGGEWAGPERLEPGERQGSLVDRGGDSRSGGDMVYT